MGCYNVSVETVDYCLLPLPPAAIQGLELFNHGEFFEAHELLEEAWRADLTPGRELYRAILQIAVAYLQIERGNFRGAVKVFSRAQRWISPLPTECRGINIGQLRDDARLVYKKLLELGEKNISTFDRDLLRPVNYVLS